MSAAVNGDLASAITREALRRGDARRSGAVLILWCATPEHLEEPPRVALERRQGRLAPGAMRIAVPPFNGRCGVDRGR
jgi:hypothetical protein